MLRKILKWMGIVGIFIFIFVGCIYLFLVRPISRQEAAIKPRIIQKADEFMKCIDSEEVERCYQDLTTQPFKKAADLHQMLVLVRAVKTRLGPRISAIVDEKSYNLNVMVSTDGQIKTVSIAFNAVYQNDPTVKEFFLFGWEKTTNDFRVQSFNVNSIKLVE